MTTPTAETLNKINNAKTAIGNKTITIDEYNSIRNKNRNDYPAFETLCKYVNHEVSTNRVLIEEYAVQDFCNFVNNELAGEDLYYYHCNYVFEDGVVRNYNKFDTYSFNW